MDEGEQERETNQTSDHHLSVNGDRAMSQQVVQKNRADEEIDQR
jgi:hypothetical protein